ncbi:MAG: IS1182 family transposase [Chloroflexi bacterium]|nr:IS1182 family transposase [Chloroflexota bacterium]
MMGQRQFQSKLYYQLSLDRLVPREHLLRRIAEGLDFSFVRPLCRPYYSHTGQPSIDPVVIFKMLLIGYLYGITSERRLAEEVSLHLGYRWFLGYDFDVATPDHSVLSKARARLGSGVFEEFFRQSIELCRQAGLLGEGPVYVDSTLIRAGASVDSLKRREDVVQPPLSVTEYLRRLEEENDLPAEEERAPDSEVSASVPGSSRALRPNQEFVSRTDPDATLVNRPDFGRHLAYKAHLAVAGRGGQVITSAVATTGAAADEHLLPEVLWQHRRLSSLGVPALVADAKYGTTANYLYLGRLGIPTFVPTTRFGNMRKDIWGREHFAWLPEEDAYLCPAGQKLHRAANSTGSGRVKYRAPKDSCRSCPQRTQCTPAGRERTMHRSWAQEFVEAAEERLASPLGKQRMVERKIYAEGTFGLAKELHGLRQTRFRGRRNVQIQVWLTAAAMNIKKAVRNTRSTPSPLGALGILARLSDLLLRSPLAPETTRL